MIFHQVFKSNLVPMVFAVPVECGEHDGEDGGGVVADQAHDVPGGDTKLFSVALQGQLLLLLWILIEANLLVVPVIECPFCHLEMRTADTFGQLVEEGYHHLLKHLSMS